jgi:hypothetical protein
MCLLPQASVRAIASQQHESRQLMSAIDSAGRAETFDFGSEAELYSARPSRSPRRQQIGYRRFAHAAEAIRFAIEELPAKLLIGAYLEVGDTRLEHQEIRRLYESAAYPLPRGKVAS